MAHFYRLIFLFLCSSFFSAHALIPLTKQFSGVNLVTPWFSSSSEVCAKQLTDVKGASTCPFQNTTCSDTAFRTEKHCPASGGYAASVSVYSSAITSRLSCPANSTSSGGSCACNAGFSEQDGLCVSQALLDKQACDANAQGLNFVEAPLVHFGGVGLTACFGGFVVEGTGSASGGGQTELYGPFRCSGESASACTTVPKPSSIATTCAAGSYPGTVNGVQVCVPPSSIVDAPKTTTATPPTAGASAPAIPNAPPGTTSTTEQTTCTGTQCTTTTTFKNSAGASLGTQAESKPVTSFCAENPTFQGCKEPEKNKWGSGSCTSPPPCSGDAVMCAIALESFKTSCSLAPPANPESALYDSEKTKTGVLIDTLPGSTTVGISSASFNTTNAIGGGAAGMSDKTVVIAGHSVNIPFSNVNSILGTLGTLLMGIGFLLAGRIVTRG